MQIPSTLSVHDLDWAVRRLPKNVSECLKAYKGRVFLAGGYLRSRITGEKVSDIDLFAPSREVAHQAALSLTLHEVFDANGDLDGQLTDPTAIYTTENAFTVKRTWPMVQFIHKWTFENPVDAIESFDFTIAKAAIWYDGARWQSVCHPDYYADLCGKRLVYTSPIREEAPGGSLLRVLKFYQKGYRIPLDSLAAVLARLVNSVDLAKVDSANVINKRGPMASKEEALAFVLSGLLREVDPNIDPDAVQPLAGTQPETEESVDA